MSLFRLAKQIRLRLGKQGYLIHEAADDGFQTGGELPSLLASVLDGTEPKKTRPFYQQMQEIYEQQKKCVDVPGAAYQPDHPLVLSCRRNDGGYHFPVRGGTGI